MVIIVKILYTAFKGKNNTSKIILDNLNVDNKLYLTNSFITSVKELYSVLDREDYDLIISLGQYPDSNNSIKLELMGENKNDNEQLFSNYDYEDLKKYLLNSGYQAHISKQSYYLCNNIFYYGLKYIKSKKIKTQMIFIHVPDLKEIDSPIKLARVLEGYFNNII